jgi:hypothetical protein
MNLGSSPTASSAAVDEQGRFSFSINGWPITLVDTRLCWVLPAHGSPYGPVEEKATTQAHFAQAAARVKPTGDWVDRLRSLAEVAGKPVLADYYRGERCSRPPDVTPAPEDDGTRLDRFCAEAQYLWWTRGDTLLLRKRDWITQSAYEAPDSWLTRSAGRLAARNGAATSADLALVSELTAAQIDGLGALARGGWIHDSSDGEAVRAVITLAAAPLRLRDRPLPLASGTQPLTLTLGDLAPSQRRSLVQLGESLGWRLTADEVSAFRLRIFAGPRAGNTEGNFLPVDVEYECGPGHRMRTRVHLPLRVPRDRRGAVVVEPAP